MVMKNVMMILLLASLWVGAQAQGLKRVYNEDLDPMMQIDKAVKSASQQGKHVMCQVGGNWCIWCLRFADFVEKDSAVNQAMHKNYEYIHVNYNPRTAEGKEKGKALLKRLGNCGRFGYPVMVVLNGKGQVVHIQDSGLLEEGNGYSAEKVLRFLGAWTRDAVDGNQNREDLGR